MHIAVPDALHRGLGGQVLLQPAAADVGIVDIEGIGTDRVARIRPFAHLHACIQLLDDGKAAGAHLVVEDDFQVDGQVFVIIRRKVAAVEEGKVLRFLFF